MTDYFDRDTFYTRLCSEEQALADAIGKQLKQSEREVKIGACWIWFRQPHHGDRARQVHQAMETAGGIALAALQARLPGLPLASVWPTLRELCHDIGLYLGGAALSATLVDAGLGALAPGFDEDAGVVLRHFVGIAALADATRLVTPEVSDAYQLGVAEAWGRVPDLHTPASGDAPYFGADFQLGDCADAAHHFARGHEAVVMALLTAISAQLRRDKDRSAELRAALRQSKRLGPAVASWVGQNARRLCGHPQLQASDDHAGPAGPITQSSGDRLA